MAEGSSRGTWSKTSAQCKEAPSVGVPGTPARLPRLGAKMFKGCQCQGLHQGAPHVLMWHKEM